MIHKAHSLLCTTVLLAVLAVPTTAFGEDDQHASGSETNAAQTHADEGPSLFEGDLGNIFWSLITFGAVLLVLGKFAWGPVLGALQKREDFIRESLAQAKSDRESAEARLLEYEKRLDTARQEATAIVEEGRRDADVVRQRVEREALTEASAMIERAKRDIGLARDTAVKDLFDITARLATDVAGKIVAKELSAADHERLVAESIEQLAQMPAGGTR